MARASSRKYFDIEDADSITRTFSANVVTKEGDLGRILHYTTPIGMVCIHVSTTKCITEFMYVSEGKHVKMTRRIIVPDNQFRRIISGIIKSPLK